MNAKLRKKLTKVWKGHPEYVGTLVFRNKVIHRFFDKTGKTFGFPCPIGYQIVSTVLDRHKRNRKHMKRMFAPTVVLKSKCKPITITLKR